MFNRVYCTYFTPTQLMYNTLYGMKHHLQGREKRMEREALSPILPTTCSICGGTEFIYAESELNIVKPYLVTKQKEEQGQDASRYGYMKMEMNVLVCTGCGHSVFYAKEPHKLKNKREGMIS